MSRLLLTLTLLLLFVLEGTVIQFVSPSAWGLSWMTVPRFALVGTLLVSMFLGRREGLYYGLAIGLLHDVLYGQVVGLYMMTMMVASYFAGLIVVLFQRGFAMVFITCSLILFGHEWLLYSTHRLFATAPLDVRWMLNWQIIPTTVLNILFGLLIYLPMKTICKAVISKREVPLE
ncbi:MULTISPECIES: rod shape-determining protein MreD [Brevibacillus]|jgi:rod shape-determining protein MreD|uniref:Rod shape-determining protein n=1 Tax=Brevibacillus borstelensis AK1 TaxID=1300222 RepID=M8D960_9BACL|nr:rod shape-determining protein MreD [Brevibacillus borstelensis]EMT52799.1 rod shape-determining protein [Brevibacillus borstelensis AK1]KKX55779.1 rod shape-determining protein MreD [Brevibacillus borstelensis cifa_chp40]MBE5394589.1 rod shape-determining protein MreD [Brevibacillus borstelensis]MCC0565009.1 rod shape-determining protein MreD [Brevibacillus borstelensis]MCM3470594.1 rod shape-determining protein MreD [Brevibacillus borstelensis]